METSKMTLMHCLKEYYNLIYVYKLQRLKDECKKNPNNQKIVNQYKQIKQEKEKLQNRTFTLYELKQFGR